MRIHNQLANNALSLNVDLHREHFPSVVTPDRSHHKFVIPWIQVSVGHWTSTLNNNTKLKEGNVAIIIIWPV